MGFDSHPDANQMSALLGGELRGEARHAVIAHLTRCAECRQWAGFAQTASGASGVHRAVPARGQRWTLYALPAAAALALAGALWLRPAVVAHAPASSRARATAPASAPVPAATAAIPARPAPTSPSPSPATAAVLVVPAPAPRPDSRTLAALVVPQPSAPSGEFQPALDFSPLMTGFQDQPAVAVADARLEAQYLPWADTSQTAVLAASPSAAPVAAVLATPFDPSLAPATHVAHRLSGPYAPRRTPGPDMALGWAVSRGGAVLHSVGVGIWAAVPLVPGLHFRAVFASGTRIWAGADAAQLFFSSDRGAHWRHLQLPEPNPHQVDIASIEFHDAQNGVVTLANGHAWTTSDGGDHWQFASH